jgi:hypothetical protein
MTSIKCRYCPTIFEPSTPNQIFCKSTCRTSWHNENSKLKGGLPAVIKSVRLISKNRLSVVLHFDSENRKRCDFDHGQTVRVISDE